MKMDFPNERFQEKTSPEGSGGLPEGRHRVRIGGVSPSVDGGRYPVKRIPGESLEVSALAFADGHEPLSVLLEFREEGAHECTSLPMSAGYNDLWRAVFSFRSEGMGSFRLLGWIDEVATWQDRLKKKYEGGQREDLILELQEGMEIVRLHLARASDPLTVETLRSWLLLWADEGPDLDGRVKQALDLSMGALAAKFPDPRFVTATDWALVHVERERALRGAWYEFFPRSASSVPGVPGTLKDARDRLSSIAAMGFDVVYLPPIHPIGRAFRKGPNNTRDLDGTAPGSPWAIGAEEGGHTAIHPDLGTMADFLGFVESARTLGLEVAIDMAFQCSPDHPYVRSHPDWYRHRADGSIHYAENPPKKYQDIYPFDFLTEDWQGLWRELLSVVLFWVEKGVRIFRVDNPHTKPFPFWEWLLREVRKVDPGVVFLAEAFTRPSVMYHLAHIGFSQSYTYFTWKNTKAEIEGYLTELTTPPVREAFRPNLWPNTPDILHRYLQTGGRPAFLVRLMLAATLSASYGIYGPVYELCENRPAEEGSEEYLNSEKYEIRTFPVDPEKSLVPVITRLNALRKECPELGFNHTLAFHPVDNDQILAFSKRGEGPDEWVLGVANLDPFNLQTGSVSFAPGGESDFEVQDLMDGTRHQCSSGRIPVRLDPGDPSRLPFHLFRRLR
jgi:starch synthase (maltosyl-transferring)